MHRPWPGLGLHVVFQWTNRGLSTSNCVRFKVPSTFTFDLFPSISSGLNPQSLQVRNGYLDVREISLLKILLGCGYWEGTFQTTSVLWQIWFEFEMKLYFAVTNTVGLLEQLNEIRWMQFEEVTVTQHDYMSEFSKILLSNFLNFSTSTPQALFRSRLWVFDCQKQFGLLESFCHGFWLINIQ